MPSSVQIDHKSAVNIPSLTKQISTATFLMTQSQPILQLWNIWAVILQVRELSADKRRQSATSGLASMTFNEMESQHVVAEDFWSFLFKNEINCSMDYSFDSSALLTFVLNVLFFTNEFNREILWNNLKQWSYSSLFQAIGLSRNVEYVLSWPTRNDAPRAEKVGNY